MLKPPGPTIPGMTDTLDFVKNLWGSMHLPGSSLPGMSGLTVPTLSTDDLDKRIADLKAVESWLNLNLTMLRGSIQALEVQRGTLATLQSMGASMADALRQSGVSAEKMSAMPFAPFFGPAGADKPKDKPAPAPAGAPKPAASGAGSAQPGAAGTPSAAGAGASDGAAPASSTSSMPAFDPAAAAALGMPAAMAWWNMLQEQFTQAVTSAMTSAGTPPPAAAADGAGAAKPDGAATAPKPQAQADTQAPGNGVNGRARRTRADKP